MHNSSESETSNNKALELFAMPLPPENPSPVKIQAILERGGKPALIEHFVHSQALLVQNRTFRIMSDSPDDPNGIDAIANDHSFSQEPAVAVRNPPPEPAAGVQLQATLSTTAPQSTNVAKKKKKKRKPSVSKPTQIFAKRLSLFRAKGDGQSTGIFSTSKQSKIIHIGNHEIHLVDDDRHQHPDSSAQSVSPPPQHQAIMPGRSRSGTPGLIDQDNVHHSFFHTIDRSIPDQVDDEDLMACRDEFSCFGPVGVGDEQDDDRVEYFQIDEYWAQINRDAVEEHYDAIDDGKENNNFGGNGDAFSRQRDPPREDFACPFELQFYC